MIPTADFQKSRPAGPGHDRHLDDLSKLSVELGFGMVDLAGFLTNIEGQVTAQTDVIKTVRDNATCVLAGNAKVRTAIETVTATVQSALEQVDTSIQRLRAEEERTKDVATWVQSIDTRMAALAQTLKAVQSSNNDIASIASHVNILAINAKIEAARAGDAGRGFAVVANAINDLSRKTATAAGEISDNIKNLSINMATLREEADVAAQNAARVLSGTKETDTALNGIADGVAAIHTDTQMINTTAATVGQAIKDFQPGVDAIAGSIALTAQNVTRAHQGANSLVDKSEAMVQHSVSLGGSSSESRFIKFVQETAALISAAFEDGIKSGRISESALRDFRYRPIAGTDPEQMMAPFTRFTDQILPAIQERALVFDTTVTFCAAVDRNGYLPTHNNKFSRPQGPDLAWNMANCRNRRIFSDRVGLKAGSNKEPFLLQVYRRDMGGGKFAIMKDLSAPIFVNGLHWGGLRMGYG